jgi:hypothetical protein
MSFSVTRADSVYDNQFIIHNTVPYAAGLVSYNVYDSSKVPIPEASNLTGQDTGPWASAKTDTYTAPLCYIECNLDSGGTSPLIPLIVPTTVSPALPVYATAYIRNIPDSGPKG